MIPTALSDPAYHDDEAARKHLEAIRWPNGAVCPLCGIADQARPLAGKSMGPGWYYCGACKGKFTVRTGSVMERSHIPLHKWLLGFRLFASSKKGFSAHQLHRTLGITYKSAWFMAMRIREAMMPTDSGPLGGPGVTVEADETFYGTADYQFITGKGWRKKQGALREAAQDRHAWRLLLDPKRSMVGIYQHCDEKHLRRCLIEFDFRYSNRSALGIEDAERASIAIKGAEGKRLTYRQPRSRKAG